MAKLNWLTFVCPQAEPPEVPLAHLRLPLATTRGRGGKPHPPMLLRSQPLVGCLASRLVQAEVVSPDLNQTQLLKLSPSPCGSLIPAMSHVHELDLLYLEMWAHSPHFFFFLFSCLQTPPGPTQVGVVGNLASPEVFRTPTLQSRGSLSSQGERTTSPPIHPPQA